MMNMIFFFKQKTAYEMRISDWSSDVCSTDLGRCSAAAVRGSEVSPGGLLQNELVQRQIRNRAPKPQVLLLQILHPASLIRLQTTILLAPAIIGLLADRDPPAGLGGRAALAQHNLHLTQLPDDLLGLVLPRRHSSSLPRSRLS